MKIDFAHKNPEIIEHFKGGEGSVEAKMEFDGKNRVMEARLQPGASIGLHKHEGSFEVIYILEGRPTIVLNGTAERYNAGECHYCPEGGEHTLINDTEGDIRIFAVIPQC